MYFETTVINRLISELAGLHSCNHAIAGMREGLALYIVSHQILLNEVLADTSELSQAE